MLGGQKSFEHIERHLVDIAPFRERPQSLGPYFHFGGCRCCIDIGHYTDIVEQVEHNTYVGSREVCALPLEAELADVSSAFRLKPAPPFFGPTGLAGAQVSPR